MNAKLAQELKSLQEAAHKVQRLPRSVIWGIRAALIILVLIWVAGAVYLHSVVKEDEREVLRIQQRAQQKEERLRREAAYRQSLQQQNPQNQVQNAVDGVTK